MWFWFLAFVFLSIAIVFLVKYTLPRRANLSKPKERITLPDGQILEGPDNTLGKGAFGLVERYSLIKAGKTTAVAVKKPHAVVHNNMQEREIKMLRTAGTHTNIIKLLAVVTVKNKIYMVMELMHSSVKELLQKYPHMSWPTKLSITKQMLAALVHIHGLSTGTFKCKVMVHQDLKPENLLINKLQDTENIQIKIADFGLAKIVDEIKLPFIGKIASISEGPVGGTYQYMAPEIVQMLETHAATATERESDIFSVGIILYELAVGSLPLRSKAECLAGAFPAFAQDRSSRPMIEQTTWMMTKIMVKGKPDYPKTKFFGPIIEKCISPKPSQRDSADKILGHVNSINLRTG